MPGEAEVTGRALPIDWASAPAKGRTTGPKSSAKVLAPAGTALARPRRVSTTASLLAPSGRSGLFQQCSAVTRCDTAGHRGPIGPQAPERLPPVARPINYTPPPVHVNVSSLDSRTRGNLRPLGPSELGREQPPRRPRPPTPGRGPRMSGLS